jgi:hypothetical protein
MPQCEIYSGKVGDIENQYRQTKKCVKQRAITLVKTAIGPDWSLFSVL